MHNNLEGADRAPQDAQAEGEWTAVSPRYATQLRCYVSVYALPLAIAPYLVIPAAPSGVVPAFSIGVLLIAVLLFFVWVPRRVRFTRYRYNALEIHMRTGLLWRTTVSVAINRVQHLEITQGPLERMLGISRLVLYTAGGQRSDLKLPGLPSDIAEHMKAELLQQIVSEDVVDEALDRE